MWCVCGGGGGCGGGLDGVANWTSLMGRGDP